MDHMATATPSAPTDEPDGPPSSAGVIEIDPDDEQAVPAAFDRLVAAAQLVLRAVEVNATYTPRDAVTTVERTTAVLHRLITGHFGMYVGDFSAAGARSIQRAGDLLGQARSQLSDARNHLTLDDQPPTTATPAAGSSPGR